ncbi:hypothetical protein M9Y10_039355 [Tritrichomonas musculus]|uniref:DH domain-containing protein n=1 Tax=Tritrichomonas musculus TaxID=1915356 RepID=A0ABR2GJP7_9EUKA
MIHNGICRNPYYGNCTLYSDICYKKDFDQELNEKPFQLFINPKKFYCSQIPGLRTDEKLIIDNLANFPEIFCIIIEIVTYQKMYSQHLSFLFSEITKIVNDNAKHSSLIKTFIPKFWMICEKHQDLYKEIDQIASSQSSENIIQNFASLMLKQVAFISQMNEYNSELKKNENYLIDISLENSSKVALVIGNETIIQKLKSSNKWLLFYIHSIKRMSDLFPKDSANNRRLSEISKAFQCFLNKM